MSSTCITSTHDDIRRINTIILLKECKKYGYKKAAIGSPIISETNDSDFKRFRILNGIGVYPSLDEKDCGISNSGFPAIWKICHTVCPLQYHAGNTDQSQIDTQYFICGYYDLTKKIISQVNSVIIIKRLKS